jgi:hypothetical protein
MPVASSQKDPPLSPRFRHILPKPPNYPHGHAGLNANIVSSSGAHAAFPGESQTPCISDLAAAAAAAGGQYSSSSSPDSSQFFNTHSPPILNLSPNLSPTEAQRNSPVYDLRESTRRRTIQGRLQCLNVTSQSVT